MSRDEGQRTEGVRGRQGSSVKHMLSAITTEVAENQEQPEHPYAMLFAAMSQGIICQNADGQITMANPAAQDLLGLAIDGQHGLASLESRLKPIHKDGTPFPGIISPALLALRTGEAVMDVVMGILDEEENEYRWLSVNALPVFRAGEQTPYQVFTIFQDCTELKRTKEELERTNKLKESLFSLMSHDFHSALRSIQGSSELMRDNDLSVAEMKEFAIDIYMDAQRLIHMISDILDPGSMEESGRLWLNRGWLDLNAIIADVGKQVRTTTPHLIRLQLARALPILVGDAEKLAYVIEHLLENAIRYSPDGGEVCVSSVVESNVVHVSVRDQGIGIPLIELEKIFEGQACSDENMRGLVAVREIIQMHGGEIWVESSAGVGSIFHFTVPFILP